MYARCIHNAIQPKQVSNHHLGSSITMQKARQRDRPTAQSGKAAIAADTQTHIELNDCIYKPTTFENEILKP